MKKFLKDWPQWDEFDKVVNKLKIKKDYAGVNRLLQTNYDNLKQYLGEVLDYARDITRETVQKVIDEDIPKKGAPSKDESKGSPFLEIYASRNQLNQLFYRQPQSDTNNTLFNSTYNLPTQISVNMLPLEAILNWWNVSISITSAINKNNKMMFYHRETKHKIEHLLMNKKINSGPYQAEPLPQDLRVTSAVITPKSDRNQFIQIINIMAAKFKSSKEILDFIKKDIELLPEVLYLRIAYQRYMNKYPYIRYLYKDSTIKEDCNYDIQLREIVSPQYATYLGKIDVTCKTLTVKCNLCNVSFVGDTLINDLRSHFTENHVLEPNFECSNCNQNFTMANLAQNWWTHRCGT